MAAVPGHKNCSPGSTRTTADNSSSGGKTGQQVWGATRLDRNKGQGAPEGGIQELVPRENVIDRRVAKVSERLPGRSAGARRVSLGLRFREEYGSDWRYSDF